MKKKDVCLTPEQCELVTAHLPIVQYIIRQNITIHNDCFGFEYDDLFQEGCLMLCRAAATYDITLSKFTTYASTIIRNGLINYCRDFSTSQLHNTYFSENECGELISEDGQYMTSNDFEMQLSMLETIDLLRSCARNYKGCAKLGITSLELKIKGLTISEIAKLYGVPPSHVGAWISKSKERLLKDPAFLSNYT